MNKSIGFLGILLLTYCCSVKSEKTEYESIIEEWIGKKIVLPRLSNQFKYDEKVKVVTKINGNCFQCISRLELWSRFIDEIERIAKTAMFSIIFISVVPIHPPLKQ